MYIHSRTFVTVNLNFFSFFFSKNYLVHTLTLVVVFVESGVGSRSPVCTIPTRRLTARASVPTHPPYLAVGRGNLIFLTLTRTPVTPWRRRETNERERANTETKNNNNMRQDYFGFIRVYRAVHTRVARNSVVLRPAPPLRLTPQPTSERPVQRILQQEYSYVRVVDWKSLGCKSFFRRLRARTSFFVLIFYSYFPSPPSPKQRPPGDADDAMRSPVRAFILLTLVTPGVLFHLGACASDDRCDDDEKKKRSKSF